MWKYVTLPLLPWPSFSHTVVEVENALYLGLEATRHDCCTIKVRRTIDSARCGLLTGNLGNDRGAARAKFLREIIAIEEK